METKILATQNMLLSLKLEEQERIITESNKLKKAVTTLVGMIQELGYNHNEEEIKRFLIGKITNFWSIDQKEIEILCLPFTVLDLSVRTSNCLRVGNIEYVGDLIQKQTHELLSINNLWKKWINEINDNLLMKFWLHLGRMIPNWDELRPKEQIESNK